MVTYFILAAAFIMLGVRLVKLLLLKRRNLSAENMDQHLLSLLNEKRERP